MAKRSRVVLSIEGKLNVCEMFRSKLPKTDIMLKYSIGKSTLSDIIRKEESLNKFKMGKSKLTDVKKRNFNYPANRFAFNKR